MADRYCPFCGELVTSGSITCPKCYRKIPAEPAPKESKKERTSSSDSRQPRDRNDTIALVLCVIPGLFGILGLGQIYRDYHSAKGYLMLLFGLAFFIPAVILAFSLFPSLMGTVVTTIMAIPLFIIYGILYLGAIVDIMLGNVFRISIRSEHPVAP